MGHSVSVSRPRFFATRSSSGWASQTSGRPRRPRRYSFTIDSRISRYSMRPGRGSPPTPQLDCGPFRTLDIPARLPCPPPHARRWDIGEAGRASTPHQPEHERRWSEQQHVADQRPCTEKGPEEEACVPEHVHDDERPQSPLSPLHAHAGKRPGENGKNSPAVVGGTRSGRGPRRQWRPQDAGRAARDAEPGTPGIPPPRDVNEVRFHRSHQRSGATPHGSRYQAADDSMPGVPGPVASPTPAQPGIQLTSGLATTDSVSRHIA